MGELIEAFRAEKNIPKTDPNLLKEFRTWLDAKEGLGTFEKFSQMGIQLVFNDIYKTEFTAEDLMDASKNSRIADNTRNALTEKQAMDAELTRLYTDYSA
jgi:hypothetical protein